jgi:hypothetical protein
VNQHILAYFGVNQHNVHFSGNALPKIYFGNVSLDF